MTDDLLDITLLRLGRSAADDEGKFEGRYDSPLTEVGQAQALLRGERWRRAGVSFDAVIASTLQRAQATARIVAGCLELPVESDADWMEVDHGALAGLTFTEGRRRFPRPAFRGPFDAIAGGESEVGLHARAARAVENLIRRGPGRWLVVSHGGMLNAAMRIVTGAALPVNGHGAYYAFGDLGYLRLTYDPASHRWLVLEMERGLEER